MNSLQIALESEQIEFNIRLRHFITDWASAQRKFLAGITRRLHDLTAIQPHDLNTHHTNSLGDASCSCRLFAGSASIVLNADTLKLNFTNVTQPAYEVIFKTVRRGWEFLTTEFPENGVSWFSIHSSQDVLPADDTTVDIYLEQFAHKDALAIAQKDARIVYRPSIRVTLKEHDGGWQLHRSVEESTSRANGLFVTTSMYIDNEVVETFGDFEQPVAQLHEIADQAVGLNRIE